MGEGDEVIFPQVIFIIANVIIFFLLISFVYRASSGALVYEQVYAKEISLILDNAKPNTNVSIDFSKGFEISEKNGWGQGDFNKLVNVSDSKVHVSLAKEGGYYSMYFSDLLVEFTFDKVQERLIIKIK